MTYTPKSKDWFIERIGKRIYRDCQNKDHDENCSTCKRVTEEGIVVQDKMHAWYLSGIDADFGAEGIKSNYRDSLFE